MQWNCTWTAHQMIIYLAACLYDEHLGVMRTQRETETASFVNNSDHGVRNKSVDRPNNALQGAVYSWPRMRN